MLRNLRLLNISENNISILHGIEALERIEEFYAYGNRVSSFTELARLGGLMKLRKVYFRFNDSTNPVAQRAEYRKVAGAVMPASVEILDRNVVELLLSRPN